jgi:hypothetical protein
MKKRGRERNDGKGMRQSGKKGEGTWRPFSFIKKLATQQLFPSKATDM